MPILALYWKQLILAALVAFAGAWLYRAGGNAAKAECAADKAATLLEQQQALQEAQRAAADANEALRARLAKPAPGRTIREVVRANPSDCRIDPAVSDGVREAVKRANQAAAS